MKIDKKSLIEYDLNLYQKQYKKIQDDLQSENIKNDENLTKENLRSWLNEGIFVRRLNVRGKDRNFYITSAPIKRKKIKEGLADTADLKFGDNDILYSVFQGSRAVEAAMQREIGDHEEDDRLKPLDLIGEYKPLKNNLLDVKYETIAGKEYIKNANNFLHGIEEKQKENQRIDIGDFFRLKFELAAQGMQARALYDKNNCIIDGAAGTGKSTIAIQKLKYFIENNNIEQSHLLIVVRNHYLKQHFSTLLQDSVINLKNVKIQTIDEVFDIDDIESIEEFIAKAKSLQQQLNEQIQKRDIDSLEEHYFNLFNHFGMEFFHKKISILLSQLNTAQNKRDIKKLNKDLEGLQVERSEYISTNRNEIAQLAQIQKNEKDLKKILKDKNLQDEEKEKRKKELNEIRKALFSNKISKHIKTYDSEIRIYEKKIDKLEGKQYQTILNNLTPDSILPVLILDDLIHLFQNREEASGLEVLKWFVQYKNYLQGKEKFESQKYELEDQLKSETSIQKQQEIKNEIIELDKKFEKKFENANRKYFNLYAKEMKKVYFSKEYLKKNNLIKNNHDTVHNILNIMPKQYNTVIIDEAQDFSKQELEYIRIHTERVILTGDILQNIEVDKGLKAWRDILSSEQFINDNEELNIHSLKHNFRQTYQLANVSYNYRQLLLEQKMEDISSDYFENEKTFNGKRYPKPKVLLFGKDLDAMEYFDSKQKHILSTYTERFPIVAVYQDDNDVKYYEDVFSDYSIARKKIDKHADMILLHINDIKGEEFPIVFANVNSFTKRELYLIMTRAQFELDLFSLEKNITNKYIEKLKKEKWIDVDNNINFIELIEIENNEIKPRSTISDNELENTSIADTKIDNKDNLKLVNNSIEIEQNYNEVDDTKEKEKFNKEQENRVKSKESEDDDILENQTIDSYDKEYQSDSENDNLPTTQEQILKHRAQTHQYDEAIDPDIITNEEKYQEDFIKKVRQDIEDYDISKQEEILTHIVIIKRVNKKKNYFRNEIREYLFNTYKGYCQVCGFSFRKVVDGKKSFNMFNWDDMRIVKNKKSFVSTADSLCLCRNCSANIKWGAFEPLFMDKINGIDNFSDKSLDEIKEIICNILDKDVVNRFKVDYEWDDIYALEIELNEIPKNIYFTNGHLIQFIAYLQLEDKM